MRQNTGTSKLKNHFRIQLFLKMVQFLINPPHHNYINYKTFNIKPFIFM